MFCHFLFRKSGIGTFGHSDMGVLRRWGIWAFNRSGIQHSHVWPFVCSRVEAFGCSAPVWASGHCGIWVFWRSGILAFVNSGILAFMFAQKLEPSSLDTLATPCPH